MCDRPDFTIRIYQNPYLSMGGTQVHAIAQVEAHGGPAVRAAQPTSAAEVIIVDTSASMVGERLVAAKAAAKAAVDALRDGVDFAVISGSHEATMVYPRDRLLARTMDSKKADAKSAISRLRAAGGTRIGHWLALANGLFADYQHEIRHVTLLTDGKNEHEDRAHLDAVLADCVGRFVCDCRGVGADWEPAELRQVATTLSGGFGMVADPRDLTADFADMIESAMGKAVADVVLRVWTPSNASLRFVKQRFPSMRDLTDRRTETGPPAAGPATNDYPTGNWGQERRDYHLLVTVAARRPSQEMLAAEVSMVLTGSGSTSEVTLATGKIIAKWTDDETQSTRLHPSVEHYSKQEELADSVQRLRKAHQAGDLDAAEQEVSQARSLARQTGNERISQQLAMLADPATGELRPKGHVDEVHLKILDTESSEAAQPPPANTPSAKPPPAKPPPANTPPANTPPEKDA